MSKMRLPAVTGEQGLTQYFREIWSFPILTQQQEYDLATSWREHGDIDAAHTLVTSHLRLVAKIAMGYRRYGLPVADLIAEGNIGLMKAVKKFEPEKGFRLATYAMWWIRAAITEYVLRSWSLVKMGTLAGQKKLFFSLGRIRRNLNLLGNGEIGPEQVTKLAGQLNLSEQDVIDMDRRLSTRDVSLNAPVGREDGDGEQFQDTLVDTAPSPETMAAENEEKRNRRAMLMEALQELPERERHIISERRLKDDPMTLEQLGDIYGISRERVRQLEARAFDKVTKIVSGLAEARAGSAVPA